MHNPFLGTWLRQRWERRGFSAAGLARASAISRSTLERLATGGNVSRRTIQKLAGPLRLTPAELDSLIAGVPPDGEMDARLREMGE